MLQHFVMLKRTKHDIYPDHEYQNGNYCWHLNIY